MTCREPAQRACRIAHARGSSPLTSGQGGRATMITGSPSSRAAIEFGLRGRAAGIFRDDHLDALLVEHQAGRLPA